MLCRDVNGIGQFNDNSSMNGKGFYFPQTVHKPFCWQWNTFS